MDKERNSLYNKFYTAFRQLDGVGIKLAHVCAESAVEVCNDIVAEVDTTTEKGGEDFPWELLPNNVGSVKFMNPGTTDPIVVFYDTSGHEMDRHICAMEDCGDNIVDLEHIPDKFKHGSWDEVVLERPASPF